MSIDLATVARDLRLPQDKINKTVELLDQGNTIPFITRFRKDETGGLNEKQILSIEKLVNRKRALEERRDFVVKSIDSQGKLTDELRQAIADARTLRQIEDLYLPFRPKKQSLASTAKQRGLEPLADRIMEGNTSETELAQTAPQFVRVDKDLPSLEEVFAGVQHILADRFSDNGQLRSTLREILWETGELVSTLIEEKETETPVATEPSGDAGDGPTSDSTPSSTESSLEPSDVDSPEAQDSEAKESAAETIETESQPSGSDSTADSSSLTDQPAPVDSTATEAAEKPDGTATANPIDEPVSVAGADSQSSPAVEADSDSAETAAGESSNGQSPTTETEPDSPTRAKETGDQERQTAKLESQPKKKKKKKKKKKSSPDPFKDYHDFKQQLKKLPHHRVLAINRGERSGRLKVKIAGDTDKMLEVAKSSLVPADHPQRELLEKCVVDSLHRLIIPGLAREFRRELTENAERHAVEVFAHNLKCLLLQRPVSGYTILAIDPGYKRGCSVAVIDPSGKLMDEGHIFVVGNKKRREESEQKLAEWIRNHDVEIVAIGNGAACRETEQMVSEVINLHFPDQVKYTILNGAGASAYSTSEIGREELPDVAPSIRSAVSIGRRLIDPLSELVKIAPANIGVGMYQHDVKAKHLSESLDRIVELCVNRVGVNVNTASPALLRYVSGLNQLTARRIFEYRQEHGPFSNREKLREVTGFGDATYVQSAGFLRINEGEQPLDRTSIHPESYQYALQIMDRINATPGDLFPATERVETVTRPAANQGSVASNEQSATPSTDTNQTVVDSETTPAAQQDSAKSAPNDSSATDEVSAVNGSADEGSAVNSQDPSPAPSVNATADAGENDSAATASQADPAAGTPATGSEPVKPPAEPDSTTATQPQEPPEAPAASGVEDETSDGATPTTETSTTGTQPAADPSAASPTPVSSTEPPKSSATEADGSTDETEQKQDSTGTGNPQPAPTAEAGASTTRRLDSSPPRRRVRVRHVAAPEAEQRRRELVEKLKGLDKSQLARDLTVGELLVKDIINDLIRPQRDPREAVHKPIFRSGIIRVEDLKEGMQLDAQIVNVVDFGAFVDIGLGESCLVHVSQLSNRFIREPQQEFAIGDTIKVWVTEIETDRRRVKLTAIRPGSGQQSRQRSSQRDRGKGGRGSRPARGAAGKAQGRHRRGDRSHAGTRKSSRQPQRKRRPPKPVKPITQEMLEGKEPMRSFSDLMQFVTKKPESKPDDKEQE